MKKLPLLQIFYRAYAPCIKPLDRAIKLNDIDYVQYIAHKLNTSAALIDQKYLAHVAGKVDKQINHSQKIPLVYSQKMLRLLTKVIVQITEFECTDDAKGHPKNKLMRQKPNIITWGN